MSVLVHFNDLRKFKFLIFLFKDIAGMTTRSTNKNQYLEELVESEVENIWPCIDAVGISHSRKQVSVAKKYLWGVLVLLQISV